MVHEHQWVDDDVAVVLCTGRVAAQLRHTCKCGAEGIGPASWCEAESGHAHAMLIPARAGNAHA